LRWRIYYGDSGGMVYDGDCADHAFRAPSLNVQVLKEEASQKDIGFSTRHGCNYFCWEIDPVSRWGGKDDWGGVLDYIGFHKGAMKILRGREVYDGIYQRVMKKVIADGNFDLMNFQPGKLHRG